MAYGKSTIVFLAFCLIANLRGHTMLQIYKYILEGFRNTCHEALTTLAETH